MQKSSLHIVWIALTAGLISILYFLSLLIHLPVMFTAAVIAGAAYLLFKRLKGLVNTESPVLSKIQIFWAYTIFITGLFLIVNKGYYLTEKYGEWDAWAIWNNHATFLKDPRTWINYLDNNVDSHPDYPLFLPALVAFFWNLFANTAFWIPFVVATAVSILIPIWIYLETYRRNIIVSGFLLLLMATDESFLRGSLSQCADHLLGLFFLGSFISFGYFRTTGQLFYLSIAAAFLGFCIWIKNEGILLAFFFIIFNLGRLFQRDRLKHFLGGICVPLIAYVIFKVGYAPVNDLIEKRDRMGLNLVLDGSRYRLIYDSLCKRMTENFIYHKITALVYFVICIAGKRMPAKEMFIILACLSGYLLIYLLTPYPLEWHLNTSLDRLLYQLSPSFLYIASLRICEVKLSLPQKQAE